MTSETGFRANSTGRQLPSHLSPGGQRNGVIAVHAWLDVACLWSWMVKRRLVKRRETVGHDLVFIMSQSHPALDIPRHLDRRIRAKLWSWTCAGCGTFVAVAETATLDAWYG